MRWDRTSRGGGLGTEVREDWSCTTGTKERGCATGTTPPTTSVASDLGHLSTTSVASDLGHLHVSPSGYDGYVQSGEMSDIHLRLYSISEVFDLWKVVQDFPLYLAIAKDNLCPISRAHIRFSHGQRSAAFCGYLYSTQYASRCRTASRCEYWDGYIFAIQATHGRRCIT